MGCYYTFYHNTYGYSLLFYKVYHEEGECRHLEFWLEKEQMLESDNPQVQGIIVALSKGGPRWAQPTRARLGSLALPGGLSHLVGPLW